MEKVFYCTTEVSSLLNEVNPLQNELVIWDVRGNYATESTVAECVKRLCLGCADKLLAASLKFPEADNFTEANDGYKKFRFPKCFGEEGRGLIDSAHTSMYILHMND